MLEWIFSEKTLEDVEKEKAERKRKTEEAVKKENLSISVREYGETTKEGETKQKITLFLMTEKGVEGDLDTIGRIDYIICHNVDLKSVFVASEARERPISGHMNKLLHFDLVAVYSNYRGYGLSYYLISYFLDLYQEKYSDFPVSIEFTNPISEHVFQKLLKEKGMENFFNEELTKRFFNDPVGR